MTIPTREDNGQNPSEQPNQSTDGGLNPNRSPTDVGQAPAGPVDADKTGVYLHKQLDENSAIFRWKITDYSQLGSAKHYSPIFQLGGHPWRLMCFPRGNHGSNSLAVYLEIPDAADIPKPWFRTAQFHIEVVNQRDPAKQVGQETEKRFSANEIDWGFKDLLTLPKLTEPSAGWLVDDAIIVQISMRVVKDSWGSYSSTSWASYDSRKETGFVGLRNQGATCYMNSLLQTLYFIPVFRKAVYHMPTESEEDPTKSIPLALQRVFFKLQYEEGSVETKELTTSFGWTTMDAFTQHDVQELARVLCDNLEEKMKAHPPVEGTIPRLFKGDCLNYIKCVGIPYESKRSESFYDLQLNVKGCKNVYESFDKYVEIEMLDGDNKYHAEGHGLTDAKKGVIFERLPPVLMLHLKRFEYDFERDALAKVNDRYEFPTEIDLDKYVAEDAPRDKSNTFILVSVLVHSGDVHGGHYYAYIRSKGHWYKFDDERVSNADEKQAVDDNFGGEATYGFPFRSATTYKKYANAYMLVYVRKDEADTILEEVADEDVPAHLKRRFEEEKELEEKRKQERAENMKYLQLRICTDEVMRSYKGTDLINPKSVTSLKALKSANVAALKAQIEEAHSIPAARQRLWVFYNRQNKTFRPGTLISDDTAVLEKLFLQNPYQKDIVDFCIYLEVLPEPVEPWSADSMVLFVKFYDPRTQTNEYKGSLVARHAQKLADIRPALLSLAGLPAETPISAFEEMKPSSVNPIKEDMTFKDCELQTGDIIVFEPTIPAEEAASLELPTAPKYYHHLLDKTLVRFFPLEGNTGWAKERAPPTCEIHLMRSNTYEVVARRLAESLSPPADPKKIRFTGTYPYNNDMARSTPFRLFEAKTLADMITTSPSVPANLFYEVLEVDVEELETKKIVELSFINKKGEETKVKELVPKTWKVGDLLEFLKPKLPLEETGELKLYEVLQSKFYKPYPADAAVDSMYAYYYSYFRVEEVSKEEAEMNKETERSVQVVHFMKDTYSIRAFGHPFFLVIRKGDTFGDVRKRVMERLSVPEAEMAKWKIAAVQFSKPEYAKDEDNVIETLKRVENVTYKSEAYIGLEHKDTAAKQTASSIRFTEKPIKILN